MYKHHEWTIPTDPVSSTAITGLSNSDCKLLFEQHWCQLDLCYIFRKATISDNLRIWLAFVMPVYPSWSILMLQIVFISPKAQFLLFTSSILSCYAGSCLERCHTWWWMILLEFILCTQSLWDFICSFTILSALLPVSPPLWPSYMWCHRSGWFDLNMTINWKFHFDYN